VVWVRFISPTITSDNHFRQLFPNNYFEVIFFVLGKITLVGQFRRLTNIMELNINSFYLGIVVDRFKFNCMINSTHIIANINSYVINWHLVRTSTIRFRNRTSRL